jgi:hypothetical protein
VSVSLLVRKSAQKAIAIKMPFYQKSLLCRLWKELSPASPLFAQFSRRKLSGRTFLAFFVLLVYKLKRGVFFFKILSLFPPSYDPVQ